MDDYSEEYDDAIDDSQNASSKLESEDGLFNKIIENKDSVVNEMASSIGKALQTVKESR